MLVEELEARIGGLDRADLAAHAEFLRGVSPFCCRLAEIWEGMIEVMGEVGGEVMEEVLEEGEVEVEVEVREEEDMELGGVATLGALQGAMVVRETRKQRNPQEKNSVRKPYMYHCDNCGLEESYGMAKTKCPSCQVVGKTFRRVRKIGDRG